MEKKFINVEDQDVMHYFMHTKLVSGRRKVYHDAEFTKPVTSSEFIDAFYIGIVIKEDGNYHKIVSLNLSGDEFSNDAFGSYFTTGLVSVGDNSVQVAVERKVYASADPA